MNIISVKNLTIFKAQKILKNNMNIGIAMYISFEPIYN